MKIKLRTGEEVIRQCKADRQRIEELKRHGATTPMEKWRLEETRRRERQFVYWDNVRWISETVANRLYGPMESKDDKRHSQEHVITDAVVSAARKGMSGADIVAMINDWYEGRSEPTM